MMWVRETGVIPAALCGIVTSMNIPGKRNYIISSIYDYTYNFDYTGIKYKVCC